ncbi:MAG: bifunctional phosphoribosylaminoimidazolecarboxamide formyltransferase/inosine monophosphate cyclohydrolase [Acidobacteria bacterium]|nr:MAG: bifunctional phosphoribosylaminoimidazolecarboxamide formyltransferase/inosine monophosphate cyclohydrolase [Acidobacteriota bacterium]
MRPIERALISVSDKTGVTEFAAGLAELNVEIVSTGNTHRLLSSKGIRVREISEFTGFPEMLDGRVKTLHPRVAAGVLAVRGNCEHMRQIDEHRIQMIDLVCVNLYPFAETIRKPDVSFNEAIENIDIGGPSLIRAGAKNFEDIAVVTSPEDYDMVLAGLRSGNGALNRETLLALARQAFLYTARYDARIAEYLSKTSSDDVLFPPNLFADFEKTRGLRYGENPHQKAAFYRWAGRARRGIAAAKQLQGKELSYNNIVDLEAARELVSEFDKPACAIIKHTNPCGAAVGNDLREAYLKAYQADSLSAFGSIIGFNRNVDGATAEEAVKLFVEAIIAPDFNADAIKILSTKTHLRLVALGDDFGFHEQFEMKPVSGGVLLQETDRVLLGPESHVVTQRKPSEREARNLDFAWRVVKHVKSNAIVLADNGCTVGVGAGQMSRVDPVKISIQKAHPTSKGAVLASDAFFPFRDGIDEAAKGGITAVIQPGGSVRDNEVIQAADENGMAMIFTGLRHFKH